ncbi:MAG: imelysin family protein [Saprospiraceae bacterium]
MNLKTTSLLLALFTVFCFVACGEKDSDETESLKREALNQYAKIVLASYEDSYTSAEILKQKIDAFLNSPTDAGFQECKEAWLACRIPYNQTDAFRFYGGPIDDADGPEGFLNAWPVDESFIDYVQGNSNAGIINNPMLQPVISKQVLISLNELFSESSIFTGYHAIELLLWGQDLNANSPGARPYTDYVTDGTGTASYQDRRGQYLRVCADLLLENLAQVRNEWNPGADYPIEFLTNNPVKKSLGLVFTGITEFTDAELAGERMFVAIDTKDQEHEHSCFSDDTTNDLKMNLLGVKNVYFGTYTKVDGSILAGRSFSEIAELLDPVKADATRAAFLDAEAKVNAIPAPFDQTILNNPASVQAAIDALRILAESLEEVGIAIGAEF